VGLFNKAKALANEAVNAGKRVSEVVVDHVETLGERDDRVGLLVEKGMVGLKKGQKLAEEKLDAAGEHRVGKSTGDAVRKIGKIVSEIPVLSAAVDAIRISNCVDILVAGLKKDPTNVYANLWLAESLLKSSEDIRRYQMVRGVFEPSSLLIAGAAKQASKFGSEGLPGQEKLLRRAWILASRELKLRARDANCLDVLARVYLAKSDIEKANELSKAAVMADPRNAIARITLSRALVAAGDLEKSIEWARSAVRAGSTLGYAIEARVAQEFKADDGGSTAASRMRDYENLVEMIQRADRVAYHGLVRDPAEVIRATKDEQISKAGALWNRAKETVRGDGHNNG